MASLIASLGTGKGTWTELKKIIECFEWEKIILVTNDFGKEKFSCSKQIDFIVIDTNKELDVIIEEIRKNICDKIPDTEVAVNIISGTGKEHMALISAVLKSGLGIRFVSASENNLKEV
jgi:hypothetical protein